MTGLSPIQLIDDYCFDRLIVEPLLSEGVYFMESKIIHVRFDLNILVRFKEFWGSKMCRVRF